ncbi:dienelactone hydrolase [Flaviflexus salsibiostraticola]|uniref:Dienelactone hydrolase n=1 Tax=Flaviflexus salsibiostraticola TaxID=1282737 RepID=A0A3S8Z6I0_9ACTO|nr:dienelactone hydrolase family protein [Flaviflexus salsibiostraticola]AZN29026.1 dienelactone hydrolase [Flaviflexus salsibiostraticola]
MVDVIVFHHIQGLTSGVFEFSEELRRQGHTVHVPDLFEGRTFASIEEGLAFVEAEGSRPIRVGLDAAYGLPNDLVYVGLSFGVMIAQRLAQTRQGARGALLLHSCLPIAEYGGWPQGLPVQIHAMEGDEYFAEDLPAATELAARPEGELFTYPGDRHLFTDASLPEYDGDAYGLLMERVTAFLAEI